MGILDEESVNIHLFGLKNVLRRFGFLKEEVMPVAEPKVFNDMQWVYTQNKGLYYRTVSAGDTVIEGQCLGHVEDIFGVTLETITAPASGKIVFLTGNPSMPEHGLVAGIATK